MNTLTFTKMHGLGNNYVYIDCFTHELVEEKLPELARHLSDVNTGIGSDGIILICPSKKAAAKMRIFNKDGSEGANCGNGLRCVAKYLIENNYVQQPNFHIETVSGLVEASIIDLNASQATVKINMGPPKLARNELPMIGESTAQVINELFQIESTTLHITAVSMGNPHAVFFVPIIEQAPYRTLGPLIECDKRFPKGVNVEFVSVASPNKLHCRVWERGSGVTQACGTGACAAAVVAILNGHAPRGEDITVCLEGGDLEINWTKQGDVLMTGPAVTVARGVVENCGVYLHVTKQNSTMY